MTRLVRGDRFSRVRAIAPRGGLAALALVACVGAWLAASGSTPPEPLPSSLTDAQFWQLVGRFSEPDGYFDSDNLLSNETAFQYVVPTLTRQTRPGGAYLGVGPEQNFTYILAVNPAIAFVVDIRRGNLQELLMYKALFEMSEDRAAFLSRLFARARPAGLGPDTTVGALFDAYAHVEPSPALQAKNLQDIEGWLTGHHHWTLGPADRQAIASIYAKFVAGGPSLSYTSSNRRSRYPTYAELQQETDGQGRPHGYLASEAHYAAIRRFEERNLLVPLVGDFAGPKTLRDVGAYLKAHGVDVAAFYTSNVENYLFREGTWPAFARNVSTLPLSATSTFIRACFDACPSVPGSRSTTLLDSMPGLMADVRAGHIQSYWDVLAHSR